MHPQQLAFNAIFCVTLLGLSKNAKPHYFALLWHFKDMRHVATLVSLFQSQLHAQSLPDTLLPVIHSTPSLPQLVLVALPPSFLSPFSPLWGTAAQIYLSPLLIIPPHVPSPVVIVFYSIHSPFFSPAHYLFAWSVQLPSVSVSLASISSLVSFPQDKPQPHFSLRTLACPGKCSVDTEKWLKPPVAPKEMPLFSFDPTTTICTLHSEPVQENTAHEPIHT